MLGLGLQEILILGFFFLLLTVPTVFLVVMTQRNRSVRSSGRLAELEEENRRLRAELNGKRNQP
jgi:hypothetical protein